MSKIYSHTENDLRFEILYFIGNNYLHKMFMKNITMSCTYSHYMVCFSAVIYLGNHFYFIFS